MVLEVVSSSKVTSIHMEDEVKWLILKWHWLDEEEVSEDSSSFRCGNHHEDNDFLAVKDLFAEIEIIFPVVVV